jgi:hypothetical protein
MAMEKLNRKKREKKNFEKNEKKPFLFLSIALE